MALLRKALVEAGTQKALAAKIGVSPSYLNDVLSGWRPMTNRIAGYLGYERIVSYHPLAGAEANGPERPGRLALPGGD